MKCPRCHGETETSLCPYCNLDIDKYYKDTGKFESFIRFVFRFDRFKNTAGIILFVLILIACFFPLLTLPAFALDTVLTFLLTAAVKIIALGFVGWIALSLIASWRYYHRIAENSSLADGTVVDSKSMKEIHAGGKGYEPIVAYRVNGRDYRVVGGVAQEKKYSVGEPKKVRYMISDPYSAYLDEEGSHGGTLVLGLFLLVIVILAAIFAG